MKILEQKALLLRTKNPTKVTSVIPKSAVVATYPQGSEVMVHWGHDEVKVLRNIGFTKVPHPIRGRYAWPGIYKPMDHQRTTAEFLVLHPRAFCFNDPGTAKTASCAWAIDYLLKHRIISRVLVICPLSIMRTAWLDDLFRTIMHRKCDIAHGSRDKRAAVIKSNAEIVVINFDGVSSVLTELQNGGFDLVIIDEANAVKNAATSRWSVINSLIRPTTWLWMLTGTPASQSPMDAHGLALMMNPTSVPKAMYRFRDMVMNKITNFKWAPKSTAKETVFRVLQPAIRFTREECLDLPELMHTTRQVQMSPPQQKYYEELRKEMALELAGQSVTSVHAAAKLNKLLQIAAGCVYTDDGNIIDFDITPRLKVLVEIIEESTAKILVFVPYRSVIDHLHQHLVKAGYSVAAIHGGVSVSARNDIIANFQSTDEVRILLIQPAAASHGVTLHAANTSVWWGPVTSYEVYAQANARMYRKGQKNNCLIVNLVGSPVEALRYKVLSSLGGEQEDLLKEYESAVNNTTFPD